MRMFMYTTTIGTIAMLTLAGASAFEAATISSALATCTFFVAPRVSRQIDKRGQSAVVPWATVIGLLGFAMMICVTQFGFPFWLNYPAAFLCSFLPNAPSIARARWTYLVERRCLGKDTPTLKSVYAYEGILEDIAFMAGPAASIAIAAATVPVGGMAIGAVIFAVGTVLLMSSKDTEPDIDYLAEKARRAQEGEDRAAKRSALLAYPMVSVLFAVMVLVGAIYGAFDNAAIAFAESVGIPILASAVFAIESVFSLVVSTLFGMVHLSMPMRRQFVVFAVLFGAMYALMVFIESPTSFIVIACIAAITYPLLLITANVVCESAVPEAHLTEAMSWMNSGMSVGMVIGPVAAGALIDAAGPLAGFDLSAGFAVLLVLVALATIPVVRKSFQR